MPEQHITARRMEQLGIATYLNRQDVTEERLLDAIRHVLNDSQRYRTNIRALKARHPSRDAARLGCAQIEAYLGEHRERRAVVAAVSTTAAPFAEHR
jgi:UDP:flavonoid glycosyltransferase YjiC (YdhE family)